MPWLLVLGIVVAVVVGANVFGRHTQTPFTIAELTTTGAPAGLDNRLPAGFLLRARGLGLVAGQLRDIGFRITSAFRSRAVDDFVIDRNAELGIPNLGTKGPGPHSECRGLDVGRSSRFPSLQAQRDFIAQSDAGQLATQVIAESDHVHLTYDAADLEEVGAVFVAANPTFDVAGAASVLVESAQSVGTVDNSAAEPSLIDKIVDFF